MDIGVCPQHRVCLILVTSFIWETAETTEESWRIWKKPSLTDDEDILDEVTWREAQVSRKGYKGTMIYGHMLEMNEAWFSEFYNN